MEETTSSRGDHNNRNSKATVTAIKEDGTKSKGVNPIRNQYSTSKHDEKVNS